MRLARRRAARACVGGVVVDFDPVLTRAHALSTQPTLGAGPGDGRVKLRRCLVRDCPVSSDSRLYSPRYRLCQDHQRALEVRARGPRRPRPRPRPLRRPTCRSRRRGPRCDRRGVGGATLLPPRKRGLPEALTPGALAACSARRRRWMWPRCPACARLCAFATSACATAPARGVALRRVRAEVPLPPARTLLPRPSLTPRAAAARAGAANCACCAPRRRTPR